MKSSDGSRNVVQTTLGQRLAEARNRAGLKQKQLAAMLGKTYEMVGQYERDKTVPNAEYLHNLAKATGADAGWLLMGSESPAHAKLEIIQLVLNSPASNGGVEASKLVRRVAEALGGLSREDLRDKG